MITSLLHVLSAWAELWSGPIWRAAWQGGLVFLAVWLICRVSKRIPAQARCWLWRIGFAKLLVTLVWITPVSLPILPPSTHSWRPSALPPTQPPVTEYSRIVAEPVSPIPSQQVVSASVVPKTAGEVTPPLNSPLPEQMPIPRVTITPTNLLFLAWILGVLIGSGLFVRHWCSARKLLQSSVRLDHERLCVLCRELARQFRSKHAPELRVSSEVKSPVLIRLWHPVILLPASLVGGLDVAEGISLMIGHELAHLRRRDLFWNVMIRTTQVIFFFHPIAWLADREHRLAQEIACDEMAVSILKCGPVAYAEMLVQIISTLEQNRPSSVVLGIGESFQNLKTRIEALDLFCRRNRRHLVLVGALVGGFGLLTLVQWKLVAQPPHEQGAASASTNDVDNVISAGPEMQIPDAEPLYEGKPVTYWTARYLTNFSQRAREALEKTGPTAIPFILRCPSKHEWNLGNIVLSAARGQEETAIRWLLRCLDDSQDLVRRQASAPLSRLLDQEFFFHRKQIRLPEAGVNSCVAQLTGPISVEAALVLGFGGASARMAVPDLRKALLSTNEEIRLNAAVAIWHIDQKQTGTVLPVLTNVILRGRSGPIDKNYMRALNALAEMKVYRKPGEPLYDEKPLSYWLESMSQYDEQVLLFNGRPTVSNGWRPYERLPVEAANALKSIGVTGVPFILRYVCTNGAGRVPQQAIAGISQVRSVGVDGVPFIVREVRTNAPDQLLREPTTRVLRWALAQLPKDADRLVLSELKSPDPQVQINAMDALRSWSAEQAIPELQRLATNGNALVRQAAIQNLDRLAPFAAAAGGKKGEPESVAGQIVYAGQPLGYWLDGLITRRSLPTPGGRGTGMANGATARDAIQNLGAAAVPSMLRFGWTNLDSLPGYETIDRFQSIRVMHQAFNMLSPDQRERGIRLLTEELGNSDPQIRINALELIPPGPNYSTNADFVAKLLTCVSDPNESVRQAALSLISRCGVASPEVLSALEHIISGTNATEIVAAIRGLGAQTGPKTLELLTQAFNSTNPAKSSASISGLGSQGAAAKATVPKLKELMSTAHGDNLLAIAWALWRINQDTNSVPALAAELASSNDEMLTGVIMACLAEMGPQAKAAVPAITNSLRGLASDLAGSSRPVLVALRKIDPEAAIGVLNSELQNADEPWSVVLMVQWLGEAGPAAISAVPTITNTIQRIPALSSREEVWAALAKIDPDTERRLDKEALKRQAAAPRSPVRELSGAPAADTSEGPFYHGKPLSYWLDVLSSSTPGSMDNPAYARATQVIHGELGTNALPFLLRYAYTNQDGKIDQDASFQWISTAFHSISFSINRNMILARSRDERPSRPVVLSPCILVSELKNPNPQVRLNALKLMSSSGNPCKEAETEFLRLEKEDPDPGIRRLAHNSFARLQAQR